MQKKTALRLGFAAIAGPALALGVAAPAAHAAELTPLAQYGDHTVADTEAELGAVLDDLGLEAAE